MDCNDVREKIDLYLDGLLDEADRGSLEAHAAACPQCGKALSDAVCLKGALAALGGVVPPVGLTGSAIKKARKHRIPAFAYGAAAAAAVVALAFVLSPLLFGAGNVNMKGMDQEIAYSEAAAGAAEAGGAPAAGDGAVAGCPISESLRLSGSPEATESAGENSRDAGASYEVTVAMNVSVYADEEQYVEAMRAAGTGVVYYRFPSAPEGAALLQIVAGSRSVRWEYSLADGGIAAFEWLSAWTAEDVQRWDEQLMLRSDGLAHSFSRSDGVLWSAEGRFNDFGEAEATDGAAIDAYWTQQGAVFHAELPASFAEQQVTASCVSEWIVE